VIRVLRDGSDSQLIDRSMVHDADGFELDVSVHRKKHSNALAGWGWGRWRHPGSQVDVQS